MKLGLECYLLKMLVALKPDYDLRCRPEALLVASARKGCIERRPRRYGVRLVLYSLAGSELKGGRLPYSHVDASRTEFTLSLMLLREHIGS